MNSSIERPIFFIGMPRSGTTILFEAFARHPSLAWVSNYCRMYPGKPWVNGLRPLLDNRFVKLYGNKKQYGETRLLNIYFPQPDEAYQFWNLHTSLRFGRDCLEGQQCKEPYRGNIRRVVSSIVTWQRKKRFSAKLTGPPRIHYLRSIFPDAIFVHVVRDGRAVVHSLLNVPFWKEKGGFIEPFWNGCLSEEEHNSWMESGSDPGILAALQWRRVIELTRREGKELGAGQLYEVRYEEFMDAPHESLDRLCRACGLSLSDSVHEFIDNGPQLCNMNYKYEKDFAKEYLTKLNASMRPIIDELRYL